MSKFKLAAGVILLITVGILIGSLGTGLLIKQRADKYVPGGSGPPNEAAFVFGRLARRLDLSDSQRQEIRELFDEYNEEMLDIRSEYLPAIKKATEKTFSQLRGKLDSRQLKRLDRLQQRIDHLHKRKQMRRGKAGPMSRGNLDPERLFKMLDERLDLTPAQAEQVRMIFQNVMKKRRALLSRPDESAMAERTMVREEMARLDGEVAERLSEILSEKQMEIYRSFPKMRPRGKHHMMGPPGGEKPPEAF